MVLYMEAPVCSVSVSRARCSKDPTLTPCSQHLPGVPDDTLDLLQGVTCCIHPQGATLFGRETECAALVSYLRTAPSTILVLLGPRSNGKTALLQEVLCNSDHFSDFPPSYINGRARQLTEQGVLASRLRDSLAMALQKRAQTMQHSAGSLTGRVLAALGFGEESKRGLARYSVMAALPQGQMHRIHDVIRVYEKTLQLYQSGKSTSDSWPVICTDEANVLTGFKGGSPEREEVLDALLGFFIKVVQTIGALHMACCSGRIQ